MASHIKPPRMRVGRRIKKDQVFKVKVRFEHPSFTGLGQVDLETSPAFNRAIPVSYLRNMLVYYGEDLVSRFSLTSAIADNPLFAFKLKAVKEAPVKVVFINNAGERWEVSKEIKFST
ncbi:MAG: thiosulfate oxidation carrier complex protein SoxZ [Proteobacteria bacterium]|nr:thiosulfate oxidation carrier complex protein SoxZ [Pseudomonadota bacterium]